VQPNADAHHRFSSRTGGAFLLGGLAIVILSIGLLQGGSGDPQPGVQRLKAQRANQDPRQGIVVVGLAQGERIGIQYAGGCKGLKPAASDGQQRFATVVPRNGKQCTRRPMRPGRVRAWACVYRDCGLRQVRIWRFRDSDGDGLGNLYERSILHTSPNDPSSPGSSLGTSSPPGAPPEKPLPPFAQLGCVAGATPVSATDDLLGEAEAGHDVCVTAPIGNVTLEGLGSLAGVTISSEGAGSLGAVTVKETSNLTIQGARLRSIEIRRANGTQLRSSVIGGTQADRVSDQLIFMPEASSDVAIESNDIGWTIADDSGNTGYGCRCYGDLDRLRFAGNKVHDIAADGFQGVGGSDVLIDRNEIGPVGANPSSSEHSDNIQITGNGPNLRITNNWIHHQGYFDGGVANNSGSTYIHGGSTDSLIYENNLIETNQGRTEICGLGTGGTSRSNIVIRRNTWVDGGKAFTGFPGFEWDCTSGSGNTIERNIAVDPDGGFALDGAAGAATFSANLWGGPSLVALNADGNCTSANCNPAGQEPIGYRKPAGVGW
jgi:hypothetical protein